MQERHLWLMNKDRKIADLYTGRCGLQIEAVDGQMPPYILDIHEWLTERTSPVSRENIIRIMKLAGINDNGEFMAVSHAISLNDTLWVKKPDQDITWAQVNPYKNKFSRIISEMALDGKYIGGCVRSPSPDFTLGGSAEKCWKREDGRILMYKTCGEMWNSLSGIRPYCEYYANQVTEALVENKAHYVKYGLQVGITEDGFRKPYAYCPIFTSEQYGYVPAANIVDNRGNRYNIIALDKLMAGDTESREILREMMLVDSIVMNYDRHMYNYGFLADNDSYKLVRLAPIFDLDCSLGAFVSTAKQSIYKAYEEARALGVITQFDSYEEQAEWAMTSWLRRRVADMLPFRFKRFPNRDRDLEDRRIDLMEYIVNTQIKRILKI